eukprot:GHVL01039776.1.p1 GENE.GHVL01039776.1~~GHVL01039776.1.p1  ORF type:complete len:190 (-),score=46.51 GHVL01039776.1:180-749(-)
MTEAELQGRELDEQLRLMREMLTSAANSSSERKTNKLNECTKLSSKIRTTMESYRLEIRTLPPDEEAVHRRALIEQNKILKMLLSDLEFKKSEVARDKFQSDLASGAIPLDDEDADEMGRDQIVSKGDKIQDQTQESLENTKRLVAESEQIGRAAAAKMDEQTTQLTRIHEGVTDISENLDRAGKVLAT